MAEDPNLSEIAKYEKLLSVARSSIESSQTAIVTNDKQIQQLTSSLDDERSKKTGSPRIGGGGGNGGKDIDGGDDFAVVPRRLLRRMDANELLWVLAEYETDDVWKCFNSEQELDDFILFRGFLAQQDFLARSSLRQWRRSRIKCFVKS